MLYFKRESGSRPVPLKQGVAMNELPLGFVNGIPLSPIFAGVDDVKASE